MSVYDRHGTEQRGILTTKHITTTVYEVVKSPTNTYFQQREATFAMFGTRMLLEGRENNDEKGAMAFSQD